MAQEPTQFVRQIGSAKSWGLPMLTGDCSQLMQAPVMQQIIRVESGGNPFAVGVVGNQLTRQPQSLPEALATVTALEARGFNFSIGKGQVNRIHFARLGWDRAPALGFDACANVMAAAGIFNDCHARAVKAGYAIAPAGGQYPVSSSVRAALSCYYSGDFERGVQLGYVRKVLREPGGVVLNAEKGAPMRALVSMMVD